MIRDKSLLFFFVTLVLVAGFLIHQSKEFTALAEQLALDIRSYLPVVIGSGQGPAATATLPGPTQTAAPTVTSTPSSTPTLTPSPTSTPEPGRLASPTLYDILKDAGAHSYLVAWSTVPDAEYYRLQEKRNNDNWETIYEGPALEIPRSNLADGVYCYHVKAVNAVTESGWSAKKCTTVTSTTTTPAATSTVPPGELAAPELYAIDNADGDGNYTVEWSAVAGADEYILKEAFNDVPPNDVIVYRGPNTSLERSGMAVGQYCYRVRGIILGGQWGPWSAPKCTSVTNSAEPPINCTYEIVGRIQPGISAHQMTYLPEKNIVVITGGHSEERVGNEDYGELIVHDDVYIYEVDSKEFYRAGFLQFPRGYHTAIPLDENRLLLTGGDNLENAEYVQLLDEIVHIEGSIGQYTTYAVTKQPTFSFVSESAAIDTDNELVISGHINNRNEQVHDVEKYNRVTGDEESILSLGAISYPRALTRMGERGNKFLLTTSDEGIIINIKTESFSSFTYPPYLYGDFEVYTPELTPLDANTFLLTGGVYYSYYLPEPSEQAFIYEGSDSPRRINDTQYSLFDRIALKTEDGFVVLISGFGYFYYLGEYSKGTEVFDPSIEKFYPINEPNTPHANGKAVQLENGNSFLISGGYDDYFLDDDGWPYPTTSSAVELVTCN